MNKLYDKGVELVKVEIITQDPFCSLISLPLQAKLMSTQQSTGPSTSTPEYLAFQECYETLILTIKLQPGAFCDSLFARRYIPEAVRDYTRNESNVDHKKAEKLCDSVIDQIKYDPSVFYGFIEILKSHSIDKITDKLHQCCCDHKAASECQLKTSSGDKESTNNSSSNHKASDVGAGGDGDNSGFVCPHCEKCTIDQYFSEEGCPLKKQATGTKTLFPYLDTSALMEEERESLEMHLKSDTQAMMERFSDFTVSTRKSLQERNESLKEIIHVILSLSIVLDPEDIKEIRAATCITEVFIILCNYTSFFNYQIIEHLIKHHGSIDDHKRLEEYKKAFKAFCQRSIFEVPPSVYSTTPRKKGRKFIVMCTEGVATLEGVQKVKERIAKIFDLKPLALQLCLIKKGSVELQFLISAAVADHIFPVSPSQHSALSEIGVRVLSCKGVEQTSREKTK